MLTVRSTINISSQTVPPIIPVVQGDTGRAILFTLADFTIPAGASATYYVQKPSGEAVYNNATIDGNTVLVELTAQSIIEKGDNYGQVRISSNGEVVTSFDFILLVKEFRGIDAVQSLTEMNIFDKAVEQASEAIDEVKTDALDDIGDAKEAALQEIEQTTGNFADDFSASATYAAGDYVMHSGQLYRFTANHAAGAWTGSDAESVTVGEELTDLKAETSDLKKEIKIVFNAEGISANYNFLENPTLVNGLYADATGVWNGSRTDYIAVPSLFEIEENFTFKYIGTTTLIMHFVFYNSNKARLSNSNLTMASNNPQDVTVPSQCKYVGICGTYQYGVAIEPTNYSFFLYKNYRAITTDSKVAALSANNCLADLKEWTNNIYYFGEGIRTITGNRVGLKYMFNPTLRMRLFVDDGYKIFVGSFSSDVESVATETGNTGWVSDAVLIPGTYYLINFKKNDESKLSPEDGSINTKVHFLPCTQTIGANYYVDSGFQKKNVSLELLGTIDGLQSFCRYNNKYYSTNGTKVYVYNDSFELVNTVDISLGHGNSMQLGTNHSSYAYVSGWSDNSVYVVDLDTVTLVDTITLPNGHDRTTVAVDDVNNIAYIFGAGTASASSEVYYDFVTYDYDNRQVISTKKIIPKFGAIQSCDFVNGLIFALNGTGTVPNGYRIYNSNGDVVGEFILGSFSSNEPEGVFVDRTTKDIYISFVDKKIYKLSYV